MSSGSHRPKQTPQFDDVVDLGSVPPPPGVVGPDMHAARTAIAALPTTLLEELRRAKMQDGGDASRTRRQDKFDLPSIAKRGGSFTNEAPTRPGKDGMRLLRPLAPDVDDIPPPAPSGDLASALQEALSAKDAVTEAPPPPSPPVQPAAVAVALKTPPMSAAVAPPIVTPPPARAPTPLPAIAPPVVAPMFAPPPVAVPAPEAIRIELLVAITIVGGAALVFALLAIANRVFSHP